MKVRNLNLSRHELFDRLEKKGYKQLGSGLYSKVFSHPKNPNICYKIGKDVTEGWPKYIKMVREKHRDNPYAPKVFWIVSVNESYYIAKMARLHVRLCEVEAPKEALLYRGASTLTWCKAALPNNNLVALARDIANLGCNKDMHEGNVMFTDASLKQFVITDPVY